jgi:uncharacterized protein (TIGR00369 family)
MAEPDRERTFRWTDPRALARRALTEDGIDWVRMMKSGELPPAPVIEALGMQPEELEPGRIVFSMHAQEWMCNPAAVVHGGMIATLLDTVLTVAVLSRLQRGRTCQTIQMNVNFVRPLLPTGEKVSAEGIALHVGTTIGTAQGNLHDAGGRLIAHATATLAILDTARMKDSREERLPDPE